MLTNEISEKIEWSGNVLLGVGYTLLAALGQVSEVIAGAVGLTVIIYNYLKVQNLILDRKQKKLEIKEKTLHTKFEEIRLEQLKHKLEVVREEREKQSYEEDGEDEFKHL